MKQKAFFVLAFLLLILNPLTALEDELLQASVPIIHGEESFIQRVNERTGNEHEPVGLVLSGGSARALAHIGVLQYLEENSIVPDFIISNSMGSIIALMYGAGMSPAQILEVCSSVNISSLFDVSVPINSGLLDAVRFRSLISALFPEGLKLEDLEIPVMVICEDLSSKRQILLAEGDFLDIFEASFALPFYFGSVSFRGHSLVDGGIANLVPLDVAYKYSDFVIASTTFYDATSLNLKNPLTALNVSFDIGKRRQGVTDILKHPESLWIRCNVEDVSFMEFAAVNSLAKRGYDSCLPLKDQIAAIHGTKAGDNLLALREGFDLTIDKVISSFKLYWHLKTEEVSSRLIIGGNSCYYENEPFKLRDDVSFGLETDFSWKDFFVSLVSGVLWEPYTKGKILPGIDLSADFYFLDHFKLSAQGAMSFKFGKKIELQRSGHIGQLLQYRSSPIGKFFSIEVIQTAEIAFKWNMNALENQLFWDKDKPVLSLSMIAEFNNNYTLLRFQGGALTTGWSEKIRFFADSALDVSQNLFGGDLILNWKVLGRFSLDNQGNVPFFRQDGFQTTDVNILSQGSSMPTAGSNNSKVLALVGFEADWRILKDNLSLGELILMQENSVGLFCNALWHEKKMVPSFNAGLKIKTEVGIIGIRNLPFEISLGYDFGTSDFVGSIMIGS